MYQLQENAYCLKDYCEPRFVDTIELPELRDLNLQIAEVRRKACDGFACSLSLQSTYDIAKRLKGTFYSLRALA